MLKILAKISLTLSILMLLVIFFLPNKIQVAKPNAGEKHPNPGLVVSNGKNLHNSLARLAKL